MASAQPPAPERGRRGRGRTARLVALGHDFDVEADDPRVTAYLGQLFAPFERPGQAATRYTISDAAEGCELWFNPSGRGAQRLAHGEDRAHALATLLWHVNREVVARTEDLVLLHAAGATRDGLGVVLPAPMEAGKTTLVAGLVRAGFGYLSDEIVAVTPSTLEIIAYPKALSVDPGSWGVLADLEPATDPDVAAYLPDQWQVAPGDIRSDAVCAGATPALIVAPRYVAGAETRARVLSPADAVVRLISCTFEFAARPEQAMPVLGRLAERCPFYELTVGDLADACAAVASLVDSLGHRG